MGALREIKVIEPVVLRKGLTRNLAYRPHAKLLYYSLQSFAFLLWAMGALPALGLLRQGEFGASLLQLGISSLAPLLIFSQGWFFLRPLVFFSAEVTPGQLRLNFDQHAIDIHAGSVRSVTFTGSKLFPAFAMTVEDENKNLATYRVSSLLERSEYVIESLYEARPELFVDLAQLELYRAEAIACDHRWARIFIRASHWPVTLFRWLFAPLLAYGYFYGGSQASPLTLVREFSLILGIHCMVGLVTFAARESILLHQLRQRLKTDAGSVRRFIFEENRLIWIGFAIHTAITLSLSALLKFID